MLYLVEMTNCLNLLTGKTHLGFFLCVSVKIIKIIDNFFVCLILFRFLFFLKSLLASYFNILKFYLKFQQGLCSFFYLISAVSVAIYDMYSFVLFRFFIDIVRELSNLFGFKYDSIFSC